MAMPGSPIMPAPVTALPPQLAIADMIWLNEHPSEAKALFAAHAKAETARAATLADAERIRGEAAAAKAQAEQDAGALRTAAQKEVDDGLAAIKARRLEAEAVVGKIIEDAKAEARRLTDLAAQAKADADAKRGALDARQTAIGDAELRIDDRKVAIAHASLALDRREAAIATKEADIQRRLDLIRQAAA